MFCKTTKEAYGVRRTVPPSAEIEGRIDAADREDPAELGVDQRQQEDDERRDPPTDQR
jgi:hypothetical protein